MEDNKTIHSGNEIDERGGIINEFLWLCAGVNRRILRQCPTDYAKYAGIGGTIFFTALMASLSGGYALYKVFADETNGETDMTAVIFASIFGIIWGLMIFNLDRFMVNTMYSDGTHKIIKDEWIGAAPRLLLAVFIGVVISTPIELRIFKDKIQAQLIIDQGAETQKMDETHKNLFGQIKSKEDAKAGNIKRLDDKRLELAKEEARLYDETVGLSGTNKKGYGPAAKQLQQNVDRLKGEVQRLEKEVEKSNILIDEQLKPLYKESGNYSSDRNKAEKSMKGFAAELKSLNTITSLFSFENGRFSFTIENFPLFIARILIMFLFVAIEVIPTLFKLMMIDGSYDAMLKAEKHRYKILSEKRISDINDEINTEVKITTEKNRQRLDAELLANKELMEKIIKTQTELIQIALEKWREEELAKINENPSAYINTNSENS